MALLERESELEAIEGVLDRGGVLVVEGGAGIGKTSLVNAACERGAARMRALFRLALKEGVRLVIPAGALGQVWRRASRQAPPKSRSQTSRRLCRMRPICRPFQNAADRARTDAECLTY